MSLFKRTTLVERLAGQTGWPITYGCGDYYTLRSPDAGAVTFVNVRHEPTKTFMKFTAEFPVTFPLERLPQGLCARLLLRSSGIRWSNWHLDINDSCQAQPYLCGMWPVSIITPEFFAMVCEEMTGEIRSFHQELRDKAYGGSGGEAAARPAGRAGVPQVMPGTGLRYID